MSKEALQKYNDDWNARYNELSYRIFFGTDEGKEWLGMVEQKHFYAPVAVPGKDPSYAFFTEGTNDFIRRIRNAAQTYMINPTNEVQKLTRERK